MLKINNKIKVMFCITMSFLIFANSILGVGYIYKLEKTKEKESSISTIATPEFNFQSESQYLIEPYSGNVLYANNEDEKLLPASVTKVMTLLLIMEQIDSGKVSYDDKVTCSANASKMGGSQIWFKEGEQLTIDEALKAICVVSANDVTVAIAEMIGGTESNFVSMMNKKAQELGMSNTCFKNSHGIDEDGHYSTAKDIAIMSSELIKKHPNILKYTSIWMDTLRDGTFTLSNTNNLIRYYEGANGLKTGSTSKALFNLASSATRDGTTFLAVIMRAPSSAIRAEESKQLLNYAFSTYETQNIYSKGVSVDSININKDITGEKEVITKDDIKSLIEKGNKINTIFKITYDKVKAPILKDESIGKIEVFEEKTGKKIGETSLTLKEDSLKSGIKQYLRKVLDIFMLNI
ncbi:MAG: D-alanyl-D-alanine carboxypeptidase family protein [Clostridia bacterium]